MLVVREGYNDMEMRLLFNKTGDILYIIARKSIVYIELLIMRQHIHLVFRSYLLVITENQDMLPVKEQVAF